MNLDHRHSKLDFNKVRFTPLFWLWLVLGFVSEQFNPQFILGYEEWTVLYGDLGRELDC